MPTIQLRKEDVAMVPIATLVAVTLLFPLSQPIEPVQFRDRAEVAATTDAVDRHAGRHLDIGRHYFDEREFLAALDRLRLVVTQFQGSRHTEEALALITEASLALGHDAEAQTASAILNSRFPHGHWTAAACDSLRAAGLELVEDQASWISLAFRSTPSGRTAGRDGLTTGASPRN
jgi:hypothetical protein